MKGLFGDLFDFNGDGELDFFEQAADFAFFCELMEKEEKRRACEEADYDSADYDF